MTQFTSEKIPAEDQKQAGDVFRAAAIILISALVVLAFYIFLALQLKAWQMTALASVIAVFAAATILAIGLIRGGRQNTGSWIIIIGMLAVFPAATLLIANIGVIFGAVLFILTFSVAAQTLPSKQARRANLLGVVVGTLTALLELLPLDYRLLVPQIQTFVPAITVVIVLVTIFFTVRQSWGDIANFMQSSIRNRLTVIVVGSAIIPVVLISIFLGWVTYVQVRNALSQDAFDKLAAVQAIKANQISGYLSERRSDMVALSDTVGSLLVEAEAKMSAVNSLKHDQIAQLFKTWDADVRDVASDPGLVAGVIDMTAGFQDIGSNKVRFLYLGQAELEIAKDGSAYSAAHLEQHTFFTGYTTIHGYEDALLIDPTGNVVYSTQKNGVFGSNLVTGAYKDSNLATLYKNLSNGTAGKAYIADIALFDNKYAMFIGAPIYEGSTLVGILAYQLPLDTLKNVIEERTGLGLTSETFVIARESDGRITYRSDRVTAGDGEYVIGYDLTDIASPVMLIALNGDTGSELTISSTGEAVIDAHQPLGVEGLTWAVITSVAGAEGLSPTHQSGEKDFLTAYKENYGYYDIFLIEPNGKIFYSVLKENEYQTNILSGEYKDTNLGLMVADIIKSKTPRFADFAFYAPSGGKPAAFFGIPVLDKNNEVLMVVATQASQDQLNAIMTETTGLGETGETFVLGQDKLRRTETRFLADLGVDSTLLNESFKVDTIASRLALAGETGQDTFTDFRNLTVLGVWSPVVINEPDAVHPEKQIWAVIAKLDESEALVPVNRLAGTLGLIIGLAVLGIGSLAIFLGARFAVQFVTPLLSLTDTAVQVAAGNMNLTVKADSKDEIGTLSTAFNKMTSQLRDLISSLEGRVAARTKDLATVANISTNTAVIRDPYKMLEAMVHLTQRGFNLYHAHVFRYEKESNDLHIVACGYREGDEHEGTHGTTFIPVSQEQSLVARAARTKKPVIVNDVRSDPGWLPNPLLPETRSEMAVPMLVGDELLGVMDVQADHVNAFSEEDANIQLTLAAQTATSYQSTLAYEKSQEQAKLETLINAIGQKIQRATTVDDTLQTAIRELGSALGATRVSANLQAARQDNSNDNQN